MEALVGARPTSLHPIGQVAPRRVAVAGRCVSTPSTAASVSNIPATIARIAIVEAEWKLAPPRTGRRAAPASTRASTDASWTGRTRWRRLQVGRRARRGAEAPPDGRPRQIVAPSHTRSGCSCRRGRAAAAVCIGDGNNVLLVAEGGRGPISSCFAVRVDGVYAPREHPLVVAHLPIFQARNQQAKRTMVWLVGFDRPGPVPNRPRLCPPRPRLLQCVSWQQFALARSFGLCCALLCSGGRAPKSDTKKAKKPARDVPESSNRNQSPKDTGAS